jgi:hypothetical protein
MNQNQMVVKKFWAKRVKVRTEKNVLTKKPDAEWKLVKRMNKKVNAGKMDE